MTSFKICGLRDPGNALVAAKAGADFLGFNFVPGARRQLGEDEAREVIQEYRRSFGKDGPRLVGLFATQPIDDVNRIIRRCGLDLAQLCGDEPPEYWDQVNASVIRQIKVRDEAPRPDVTAEVHDRIAEVVAGEHVPLLDKREPGSLGGTGRSFDWRIAQEVSGDFEIVLAGGLTADNVGGAIETVHPWGVDVSSGVETNGTKDPAKIRAFAEAVKQSDGVAATAE